MIDTHRTCILSDVSYYAGKSAKQLVILQSQRIMNLSVEELEILDKGLVNRFALPKEELWATRIEFYIRMAFVLEYRVRFPKSILKKS